MLAAVSCCVCSQDGANTTETLALEQHNESKLHGGCSYLTSSTATSPKTCLSLFVILIVELHFQSSCKTDMIDGESNMIPIF